MASQRDWSTALGNLDRTEIPRFLAEHSGLPGPRANLSLLAAVIAVADARIVDALLADGGEYARMCAAAVLAAGADDPATEARARAFATDALWRVREGVVLGLQSLGDRDPETLAVIARRWSAGPEPLVQRAAVAAMCEPRLLRAPGAAARALDLCAAITASFASLPEEERRQPDARALRQTLGYCWSVAIAAAPDGPGLAEFRSLDTTHPDIAWIVAENLRKRRLSRLL